MEIFYSKLEVG